MFKVLIPSSITGRLLLVVSLGIAVGVNGLRNILNEHSEEALCCLARNHGLEHSTECWFSPEFETLDSHWFYCSFRP